MTGLFGGKADFFDTLFPARNPINAPAFFSRYLIYVVAQGTIVNKVAAKRAAAFPDVPVLPQKK